jgi:hypothetical protein
MLPEVDALDGSLAMLNGAGPRQQRRGASGACSVNNQQPQANSQC